MTSWLVATLMLLAMLLAGCSDEPVLTPNVTPSSSWTPTEAFIAGSEAGDRLKAAGRDLDDDFVQEAISGVATEIYGHSGEWLVSNSDMVAVCEVYHRTGDASVRGEELTRDEFENILRDELGLKGSTLMGAIQSGISDDAEAIVGFCTPFQAFGIGFMAAFEFAAGLYELSLDEIDAPTQLDGAINEVSRADLRTDHEKAYHNGFLAGMNAANAIESERDPPSSPDTQKPNIRFVGAADLSDQSKSSLAEIIERIQEGVVQITAGRGGGSGFIIDESGLVVTNEHVVRGQSKVSIRLTDGTLHSGEVISRDSVADLALVQVESTDRFHVIAVGNPTQVRVGDEVLALGFPLASKIGNDLTVTRGIISSTRTVNGVDLLQTDAAINPGNSGGPLINRDGKVIGVSTFRIEETTAGRPVSGIGFAVSVVELERRLPELKGQAVIGDGKATPTPTLVTTVTPESQTVDTAPSFSDRVSDQDYKVGIAISNVTLPAATSGNGTLVYSLSPAVPGLRFSPQSRQLSGIPTAAGSYSMIYRVMDADTNTTEDDADTVLFTISVVMPDAAPSFSSSVSGMQYEVGTTVSGMTLPAATGGNGLLTYFLTPTVPGLNFDQATRQLAGAPTSPGTYRMTYRVEDADANTADVDTDAILFTITIVLAGVDYDFDNDGLIEVANLEQLNAIRWDADGNGVVRGGLEKEAYTAAFPNPDPSMGCVPQCIGYELTRDLDFNSESSFASGSVNQDWRAGTGWEPIGGEPAHNRFAAFFDGNGHTIFNLFIDRTDSIYGRRSPNTGLFGYTNIGSTIRRIGLVSVDVSGSFTVGALVGRNGGVVSSSFATGKIYGEYDHAGGLVGHNEGSITTSNASVDVSSRAAVGGLVGTNDGNISTSYATGNVLGQLVKVGGLVGEVASGSITACYSTGHVSAGGTMSKKVHYYVEGGRTIVVTPEEGGSSSWQIHYGVPPTDVETSYRAGGLVGTNDGTIGVSYWDTDTSSTSIGVGSGDASGVEGHVTTELQTPNGYTGIYASWKIDVDGDGDADDLWDFGTSNEYPSLRLE